MCCMLRCRACRASERRSSPSASFLPGYGRCNEAPFKIFESAACHLAGSPMPSTGASWACMHCKCHGPTFLGYKAECIEHLLPLCMRCKECVLHHTRWLSQIADQFPGCRWEWGVSLGPLYSTGSHGQSEVPLVQPVCSACAEHSRTSRHTVAHDHSSAVRVSCWVSWPHARVRELNSLISNQTLRAAPPASMCMCGRSCEA